MSGTPIYSQVVPKSQHRARSSKPKERPQNLPREFDPLNYNHGGNIQILNAPLEARVERTDKKDGRRKDESSRTRKKTENEGKVEAYLRQNQVSMRQQQRHCVRQAEHRLNLRSLPLNEVTSSRHDRTPTERRLFPGERERDGHREHRRERERDRENAEFDAVSPVSPWSGERVRARKSSSARAEEPSLALDKRRFFCREWLFQKLAHCLEQRANGKCAGVLVIGEAGSGKTAVCQELSSPGTGPQARQQRALHRRLLAAHLLQNHSEASLRPGELVRSMAMQILSHGLTTRREEPRTHSDIQRDNSEEEKFHRFETSADDGEESCKPLLADSEDQRTDEDDPGWAGAGGRDASRLRTIDRIHEREDYVDSLDAPLSKLDHVPEILPRASIKPTNPFLEEQKDTDFRLYENHENLFLRNVSSRQSKEKNARLVRQSSEPLTDKKTSRLQKSASTEQKTDLEERKIENSPPKSRIPVANFKYPNKSELKLSSNENSPHKKVESHTDESENKSFDKNASDDLKKDGVDEKGVFNVDNDLTRENGVSGKENEAIELPEYENILKRDIVEDKTKVELEILLEKKRSQLEAEPPPIPSLPVSARTTIANKYYDKLLHEPHIQQALLPSNLEKNPDECFKRALLFPLLEIDPPKQCLFILVDAIDEGHQSTSSDPNQPSSSILELLSRHQHLLPPWLLLVGTARRHRTKAKLFSGFRKIQLDELSRAHTAADVQRYVLSRLDTEPRLRARVSSDAGGGGAGGAAGAAAALDHLRIKSDGCLLYLEKVLDGVADGFIALREIREIPGTLNGLYLWLAQRLFHGRRFTKVRLLLDVLLAARCGVTEEMLYKCLLTKEYSVTRDDFNRRLHLLRRIVVMERSTGYIQIFHHSFAAWLLDVKHCTRRYLCSPADGHAALAMYYTLTAHRLSAMEIHNYVYHMTQLEQHLAAQKKNKDISEDEVLDLHTIILLWVLDSGCDLESALKRENDGLRLEILNNQEMETQTDNKESEPDTVKESETAVPLEKLVPALGQWTGDAKALTELLTLRTTALTTHPEQTETAANESEIEEPELPPMDPATVFDLVAKGDDDTLAVLLKRYPETVHLRDAGGGTALHAAARGGKARACCLLCAAGADVCAADADGWSPLRAAAWAGHPEVVDVLLEYGCDVDCVDADNRTALRAAAWSGHLSVVTRLLAAGANPALCDSEGRTPLMAAAYMGHKDIVRALLQAGADPAHTDADGRTALSVAALCGAGAEVAALLLERGAPVNACDRDSHTPLLVAALEGHTEICEVLLEAEADMEATDVAGRTALWGAAGAGHAHTVRLLLFWGAHVDNMDPDGRTVLSAAAAQGNVEVVRQLLDRGLDEHHRDNSGWTPLHYAAFEGHEEVCDALLEAGARVDEADNEGKGALLLAAAEGHARLVASLIDRWGAAVEQRAHDGKTALRLAALEGHFDTVDVLLDRGADVDALDADRRSTLYVLALDNRLAMARHLLRAGALCSNTDTEGRTPLHVSAWQGHTEMVNLLVKIGGAVVDGRDRCMRTALHAAAWRGRTQALRALLKLGADPTARCSQGATPLGIAAQEGHEECVIALLEAGADPAAADAAGRTPAKVAWRAGHTDICRLLERWPTAPHCDVIRARASPEGVRRSVHSSSTKSSVSHEPEHDLDLHLHHDKTNRAHLSLSFAQQVARMGRGRRDKDRDSTILEHHVLEKDPKLRSYAANERDLELRGYAGNTSPLYASPPRSPASDLISPTQPPRTSIGAQPCSVSNQPPETDTHFNRDTHMRIILGRDTKPQDRQDSKNKRNGIVTNPAMRLVANVRNGLDNAAANIRRTGVALAASASSANPVVKTNAFQWRKETPL